ncbi:MAG: nickel pincer cofactor biosynthesis protein LarC [Acidobacteria bacterium]|nr:nickel pincer cofactor biosynthesis protein LarC [Acidobacteriota bacterium]
MTQLHINPVHGVAGDMLLGALLGAGAEEERVRSDLVSLGLDGWSLEVETTRRAGLAATSAVIDVDAASQPPRSWRTIDDLLAASSLEEGVCSGARSTFERLAKAEAQCHGVAPSEVHFHEVGALDAIVDIVGVHSAVRSLGPSVISSGPVGLGHGTVDTAHGELALPAPATANLLVGAPIRGLDVGHETATPTGAALLATLVKRWGSLPNGRLRVVGYGAGTWDPESHANVVSVSLIDGDEAIGHDTIVELESNLDDVTPEQLGQLIEQLMVAGALDAWVVPIVMKKGRPAHLLGVLSDPDDVAELVELIAVETGTLGIRQATRTRHVLARSTAEVQVDGHVIGVKVGPYRSKPEHDDVVAVAAKTGRSVNSVRAEALRKLDNN